MKLMHVFKGQWNYTRSYLKRICLVLGCLASVGPALAKNPNDIPFELKEPGLISAALYDVDGVHMLREFYRAEPMEAGTHTISWEGLDVSGQPVPQGEYVWKIVQTDGLKSEYLMSVGTSVLGQPWPGNHQGPNCVAVANNSMVVAAGTEGPPEIVRMSFEGEVLWARTSFEPHRSPRSIAIVGNEVFYLQNNGKIRVLDFETGETLRPPLQALVSVATFESEEWKGTTTETVTATFDLPNGEYFLRFAHGNPRQDTSSVEVIVNGFDPGIHRMNDKWAWYQVPAAARDAAPIFLPQLYRNPRAIEVSDGKLEINFNPLELDDVEVNWQVNSVEVLTLPNRIAAREGHLVVASRGAECLMWLDSDTGEILERILIPGVRDVAFGKGGQLFVLTTDQVMSLSRENPNPALVIDGLVDPVAMDWDEVTDNLLLLEGGVSNQQVKRYRSDGTLFATIGREGGRKSGLYIPNNIDGGNDLSADGKGGFVLAEPFSIPRRLVRFDKEGEVMEEWFGAMGFYAHTSLDPLDPTVGYLRPDEKTAGIIQVKMDYENRSWRPLATYRYDEYLDMAFIPQRIPEYRHFRSLRRDLNADGFKEPLLYSEGMPGLLFVVDQENHTLRPLAAMGRIREEYLRKENPLSLDDLPEAWAGAIRLAGGDPADTASRKRYATYAWADENGDGRMQADELQLGSSRLKLCRTIDENLTLWQGGSHTDIGGIFQRFEPVRYTAYGAPVWDLTQMKRGPFTEAKANTESLAVLPGGDVFAVLRGGGDGSAPRSTHDNATHGWAWPATTVDGSAVMRQTPSGETVWKSGPKASSWPHPRGQLMSPRNINGFARGCVSVGDQTEQPCEFWTVDGLYVGGLFDGRDPWTGALPGGEPDRFYTWLGTKAKRIQANSFDESSPFTADDMLMGGSVGTLPDGSVVFLGHGGNDNPCYRITGFDGWKRIQGTLKVSGPSKAAEAKGSGLTARYFVDHIMDVPPVLERVDGRIWLGNRYPWPEGAPGKGMAVEWSGQLESTFSEDYVLSVYGTGEFLLWVDGKMVEWDTEKDYPRQRQITKGHSLPLPLVAGVKVPIRVVFKHSMNPPPEFHLNWESLSQPVEHIPGEYLYPETESGIE